jgi:hypothetical protein
MLIIATRCGYTTDALTGLPPKFAGRRLYATAAVRIRVAPEAPI